MSVTTLLSSTTSTAATGNGEATALPPSVAYSFELDVTAAATDSGDKLDVYIQTRIDGSNWIDVIHFTQLDGNGGAKRYIASMLTYNLTTHTETGSALAESNTRHWGGNEYRVRWEITDAGTDDASFTFAVYAYSPVSG